MSEASGPRTWRAPSAKRVILNFFAAHVLDSEFDQCGASAQALIAVCARLGVAEHACRSTLKRLVGSGLLEREQVGRTASYRLTARSREVLRDGHRRLKESLADRADSGSSWTLVAFSIPDQDQRLRHSLRARLQWAGFAPLQSGLWIAPHPADMSGLKDIAASDAVRIFTAQPDPSVDMAALAADVWDLTVLASAYRDFMRRWSDATVFTDDLARELAATEDWLTIIARDPQLPGSILPTDWPAVDAGKLFAWILDISRSGAIDAARRILSGDKP